MIGLAILAAALLGLSFAFWDPSYIDEYANVERLTLQSVRAVRADLQADMHSRILAQVRLAEVWATEEPGESLWGWEWQLNSQLFLNHHPRDIALLWLDPAHQVRWTLSTSGSDAIKGFDHSQNPQLKRALKSASSIGNGGGILSEAFILPDGRIAAAVIVPVSRRDGPAGFLVGLFESREVLGDMLKDHRNLGHSISILEGALEIYATSGTTGGHTHDWAREVELKLPGTMWRVRAWPTPELLEEMRSSLPELAVVLGALLAFMLVVTSRFGRAAELRSSELSQAHDQLELRVRERTIELRRMNESLEAEIAERRRAEESLRDLSGRLLRLQDEERRRIARELHDSTAQMLAAVSINLDQAQRLTGAGDAQKRQALVREAAEFLERTTLEIRTVSYLLHPPMLDELGLEYVIPWYADGFSRRSGIAAVLDIQPELGRLPQDVELTLFRITQEALANVHRHSGSPAVNITLSRTDTSVTLVIADRGSGMLKSVVQTSRSAELGVGIAGMRERVRQLGGQLEIASNPGGTTIRAVLNLAGESRVIEGDPATGSPSAGADIVRGTQAEATS